MRMKNLRVPFHWGRGGPPPAGGEAHAWPDTSRGGSVTSDPRVQTAMLASQPAEKLQSLRVLQRDGGTSCDDIRGLEVCLWCCQRRLKNAGKNLDEFPEVQGKEALKPFVFHFTN